MNHVNDILDELRSMSSPLADMSRAMPYDVPEEYFNGFHELVNEMLIAEGKEIWNRNINKRSNQNVPEGYFDEFPQQMLVLAKTEHLTVTIGTANPLPVPEGYFEALPEQVLAAAKASDTKANPKIIPLISRVSRNLRWAAAAILIMGIGFGSYQVYFNKPGVRVERQLAKVSSTTLGDYLQQNIDDYDMETLENTLASNAGDIKQATTDLNPKDLNTEEITQYLNETGWDQE